MLHADGSDQGTSFTDSETTPKTVTNTETYDSYTKLMLHMEGSGNSFTDSAASKAVTTNGDVTQTTAQFKLGSNSAVFNGSGNSLSLADSNDWNFGSGDFTIDFWVRWNTHTGMQVCPLVSQTDPTNPQTHCWTLGWHPGIPGLYFSAENGSVLTNVYGNTFTPTDGQWYHIAVVRNGSNILIFNDGVFTDWNGLDIYRF